MANYTKTEVIGQITGTGIVPVFFNADLQTSKDVVKACWEGGVRAFEFTNRGEGALDVFKELSAFAARECPGLILGAGTILDAPTAAMFIAAGAKFIVSPATREDVIRLCNLHGIACVPGCGSVTEICNAMELGCDMVKIFPAGSVGGPKFVKDVLAPLPWARIMATGSVEPTEDNLKAWAAAGTACVGMGSKLFPKEDIAAKDWEKISERCRKSIEFFKK